MKNLKKTLSFSLVVILLMTTTGFSFSQHECRASKKISCSKSGNCCRKHDTINPKPSKCCTVKSFYLKANITATHEVTNQNFSLISLPLLSFIEIPFPAASVFSTTCYFGKAPPLFKGNRSILLSTSKLSV